MSDGAAPTADGEAPKAAGTPPDGPSRTGEAAGDAPRRTAPLGLLVTAISSLRQAIIPVAAGFFAFRDELGGLGAVAAIAALIVAINLSLAWLAWLRRTYTTGAEDIRVESGIVSRAARSVPYERIQDVSLEQSLLPRLFGLVEVKFETGAGAGEDIKLAYLTEAEGEALRRLVRARREEEAAAPPPAGSHAAPDAADTGEAGETGERLFAMDLRRLTLFGLFEFSLAVFAVIGGLFQYAETFAGIELWDPDLWLGLAQSQQGRLESLGPIGQAISAIAGLVALLLVGSITGLVRTFLRDWGFVLEKTPRGFRRRRGLLTRSDVMMPAHRVQALVLGTGWLRYRFGWHGLKFVSLAQDSGSSSHVVAPFARLEELEPIIRAAGFAPPSPDLAWHCASRNYRIDSALLTGFFFAALAMASALFVSGRLALVLGALGVFVAAARYFAWRFQRHALSDKQLFARRGLFAPRMQIAARVKLQSVEIVQGPIARRRGYASLLLGLAGGNFAIPGLPIERARTLRREILASIAARDFSALT